MPDNYINVHAVALKKDDVHGGSQPTAWDCSFKTSHCRSSREERYWLEHSILMMEKEDDILLWRSAYHTSLQNVHSDVHTLLTQLLSLLHEKAVIAAMIKHGMDVFREATQLLNLQQMWLLSMHHCMLQPSISCGTGLKYMLRTSVLLCLLVSISRCMIMWKTYEDYLQASDWIWASDIAMKESRPLPQKTLSQSSQPHQDKTCPPSECCYIDKATAQCLPSHCGTTWCKQKRGLKTSNDQQESNILILRYCLQNGNFGSNICLSSQGTRLFSLPYVESLKALVPWVLLLTIRTIPHGFPSTCRI